MPLICPACGGKRPRLSRTRGVAEKVARWFGVYHVRCEDCQHRFTDSVWRWSDIWFARCPRCYRLDLGTWDLKYYLPTRSILIQLGLGAKRFRCEACRCNFVSFRRLKVKSTFRKKPQPLPPPPELDFETEEPRNDIKVS